jgi:membrane protein YqaA with SNARE-associated domain
MKLRRLLNKLIFSLARAFPGKGLLKLGAMAILVIGISVAIVHFSPQIEGFSKYGYLGAFLAPLLSSAVAIPIPFVSSSAGLAVTLAAFNSCEVKWVIPIIASVGGTIGELSGYYAGYVGRRVTTKKASGLLKVPVAIIVLLAALLPLGLFDFVCIAAGALGLPVGWFLLCCWVGRLPRSFLEVYLGGGILEVIHLVV